MVKELAARGLHKKNALEMGVADLTSVANASPRQRSNCLVGLVDLRFQSCVFGRIESCVLAVGPVHNPQLTAKQ